MTRLLARRGSLSHITSPPYNPAAIAGLAGWWKADALVGLSDGDAVATWADSSSAGHDLTQATSTRRPIYKTAQINGLPALQWGTDSFTNMVTPAFSWGDVESAFAVVKTTTTAATQYIISQGSTLGLSLETGYTPLALIGRAAGGFSIASSTVSANVAHVVSVVRGTTTLAPNYDLGTPSSATISTASAASQTLVIGMNSGFNSPLTGYLAEVLLYTAALSGTDRSSVEGYLKTKWGTP